MKGDDPILADDAFEEHEIAEDFMTIMHFAEQMLAEHVFEFAHGAIGRVLQE